MSYVEPRPVPLAEFPDSTAKAPGMRVIEADLTPRYGTALLGVPYADKSGRTLTLQIVLPPMEPESQDLFPCVLFVQGGLVRAAAGICHCRRWRSSVGEGT